MIKLGPIVVAVIILMSPSCVNLEPIVDQTRFYALGLQLGPTSTAAKSDLMKIHVERPNLPSYVESVELRYFGGNGEIHSLKNARWSEPVEYGVVRSLNAALGHHGRHFISYYPWPKPRDTAAVLKLNIHKLTAHANGTFDFIVDWKLESTDQLEMHRSVFTAQGVRWDLGDASSLVVAWDEAISQLVSAIYTYCQPLFVDAKGGITSSFAEH